jgi:hypothetical protein
MIGLHSGMMLPKFVLQAVWNSINFLFPVPLFIMFEYKFVVLRSSVSDTAWISSAEFHQCLVIQNFSVAVAGS